MWLGMLIYLYIELLHEPLKQEVAVFFFSQKSQLTNRLDTDVR